MQYSTFNGTSDYSDNFFPNEYDRPSTTRNDILYTSCDYSQLVEGLVLNKFLAAIVWS